MPAQPPLPKRTQLELQRMAKAVAAAGFTPRLILRPDGTLVAEAMPDQPRAGSSNDWDQ